MVKTRNFRRRTNWPCYIPGCLPATPSSSPALRDFVPPPRHGVGVQALDTARRGLGHGEEGIPTRDWRREVRSRLHDWRVRSLHEPAGELDKVRMRRTGRLLGSAISSDAKFQHLVVRLCLCSLSAVQVGKDADSRADTDGHCSIGREIDDEAHGRRAKQSKRCLDDCAKDKSRRGLESQSAALESHFATRVLQSSELPSGLVPHGCVYATREPGNRQSSS
ncbi:uncharacterized protein F5Z01DRAFT_343827 [Emericellopsis atlantica]|uniref:Uncharacterized protein n=1 Tax=Emericellopsis atlantica TaxID=2614577 RepID=A0A9P7ZFE2_9HYPO|nr:uncharacterized protein F5Z01DRAFT_343827 [Emericellopsis atlantica]KAG9250701.1 hypothetical protein F5Z01DRAFT_343827 [Emericellopsis atlantica]